MDKRTLGKLESQFYYGHRELLLDYLGEGRGLYIEGVFQHGDGPPSHFTNLLPTPRLKWKRVPLYVSSNLTAKLFENREFTVRAIGSPILYACFNLGLDVSHEIGKSTQKTARKLVIVRHTRVYSNDFLSDAQIGNRVKSFRKVVGDCDATLLLYSIEFLSNSWRSWANKYGFEIACAGLGKTEPPYLDIEQRTNYFTNLISILRNSDTVYVEGYSSAILYSTFLDRRTKILTDDFAIRNLNPIELHSLRWYRDNLPSLFKEETQLLGSKRRLILSILGYNNFPSKDTLRRLLTLRHSDLSHRSE